MFWGAVSAVRDLGRIQDIASILIRYGFSDIVRRMGLGNMLERAGRALHWKHPAELAHLEPPQRVRRALEEMGPTYIKLGQILATRVDLFPPSWIAEFEKLQTEVPPIPFEQIQPLIEDALADTIDNVFLDFDTTPIAAASIAQVHRAVLADGTAVIVKVRRPGLRAKVEADLRLMERLALLLEKEIQEVERYHPQEVVRQFTLSLRRELDLVTECRQSESIAQNFAENPNIVIPKVYWEWVSESINVQDFMDGIPGGDLAQLDAQGLDRKLLAQRGVDAVLQMILIDGYFHADPHPGNIIYLPNNRIAFIDFGMIGKLSEQRRTEVVKLLHAMVEKDPETVIDVLLDWAGETYLDSRGLLSEVDLLIDTYHGLPLKQMDMAAMLIDLTTLMRDHELTLPPDLTLLFKTLITLDGMGRQIDPDYDIVKQAGPFLKKAIQQRFRPDVLAKRGARSAYNLFELITSMPQDFRHLFRVMRAGALKLNVNISHLEFFGRQLDRAASRLTVGLVTSSLIIGSSIVMTIDGGPKLLGLPAFGLIGFSGAGLGGIWLLISIWRGGHDKPR